MINYREATVWDGMDITILWQKMIQEVPILKDGDKEFFFLKLLCWIKNPNCAVIVAEEEHKLIGFLLAYIVEKDYSSIKKGFCELIYAEPDYRNTELYKKLIDLACRKAKLLGANEVEFLTNCEHKAWERFNFIPMLTLYRKEI